jgi:hypothetical protein
MGLHAFGAVGSPQTASLNFRRSGSGIRCSPPDWEKTKVPSPFPIPSATIQSFQHWTFPSRF